MPPSKCLDLIQISILFISALPPFVCLENCADTQLRWKGDNVKALDECDVFSEVIPIELDKLVAKPQCVESIRMNFKDSNKVTTTAGRHFVGEDREVQIGSLPNKCLVYDVQIKVKCDCTIGTQHYETQFKLDPMKCYDIKKEMNFTINERSQTVLIHNEYFHQTNKYVRTCMLSVSLYIHLRLQFHIISLH